ncbi:DUF6678 family protein [Cedecea neteri]|uniref:DUF6678 family protein n=1 Tax=Cedecea neteri TaxID=158822 RepID=UPI002F35CC72
MLCSCMNNIKRNEIRLAMFGMESPPLWKITFINGYESAIDSKWFYHFNEGGYLDIHYLDILTKSVEQHATVGTILRAIHLPGVETSTVKWFTEFGHLHRRRCLCRDKKRSLSLRLWKVNICAVLYTTF